MERTASGGRSRTKLLNRPIRAEVTRYQLRPLATDEDWRAFHSIRKSVLWDARGQEGYNPDHPDDRAQGNHPFLFFLDGQPIGVIRIDILRPYGAMRRVAITEAHQRQGHGTHLMRLAEDFARHMGCSIAGSHVDREAIGFYERLGYARTREDDEL